MKTLSKYLLFPFFVSLVISVGIGNTGCNEEATPPSFLRIDTIILDSTNYDSVGSISNKIGSAWVYLNDNLQGVYQLPLLVPVIGEGAQTIQVFAGIQGSGTSNQVDRYIFYDFYESNINLTVGDTTTVTPHVNYRHIKIPFVEDFDSPVQIRVDRESGGGLCLYTQDGTAKEGLGHLFMTLGQDDPQMVCTTDVITTPKGALGYYVEMDYRNNCEFALGIKTSQGSTSIIAFYPKANWNKVYINITEYVDQIPGTDMQLFFVVPQDSSVADQEVRIDNLKLVF